MEIGRARHDGFFDVLSDSFHARRVGIREKDDHDSHDGFVCDVSIYLGAEHSGREVSGVCHFEVNCRENVFESLPEVRRFCGTRRFSDGVVPHKTGVRDSRDENVCEPDRGVRARLA